MAISILSGDAVDLHFDQPARVFPPGRWNYSPDVARRPVVGEVPDIRHDIGIDKVS